MSAGFGVRIYADESGDPGDGFAFVDFDAWHERMTTAGLPVTALADQPWGMREFALIDPSRNRVRIGRGLESQLGPPLPA